MSERLESMLRIAQAATPGPWSWQGEDYRGGWGWQMLVTASGSGIIVGQDRDGGPCKELRGYVPVDAALCIAGCAADGKPHVESVHVLEPDAKFIATFNPRTAEALVKRQIALEKVALALKQMQAAAKEFERNADEYLSDAAYELDHSMSKAGLDLNEAHTVASAALSALTAAMEDSSNVG